MKTAVDSIVGEPFQISWSGRIRNCLDAFIPKSMGFSQYPSCCQPIFSDRHFSDQKRRLPLLSDDRKTGIRIDFAIPAERSHVEMASRIF